MDDHQTTALQRKWVEELPEDAHDFLQLSLIAFTVGCHVAQEINTYGHRINTMIGRPDPDLLDQQVSLNKAIRLTKYAIDTGVIKTNNV